MNDFLYKEYDILSKNSILNKEIPSFLKDNLNKKIELRHYQIEAFRRFFFYLEKKSE